MPLAQELNYNKVTEDARARQTDRLYLYQDEQYKYYI